MKKLKLSTVIKNTNLDASLVRGLVAWHGGWGEFKNIAEDISNHGANTGISFVWYTDSVKFFRNHAPAIKAHLASCAYDYYDSNNISEMIVKWDLVSGYTVEEINQALYTGKGDARDSVYDAAVKAVTEELARVVVDSMEQS